MLGVWDMISGSPFLPSFGMRSAGGAKMGVSEEGERSEVTALTPSLEEFETSV
jgi:hypothetical protein